MRPLTWIALILSIIACEKRKQVTAEPKNPVLVVSAPEPVSVAHGRIAQAKIRATVAEGFHVQANPPSKDYLVPVELTIGGTPTLHLGAPVYPPGKPHRIEGESTPISTYDGTFEILFSIDADLLAPEGEQFLNGELSYQACDNRRCLFPASIPIEIPVRVAAHE